MPRTAVAPADLGVKVGDFFSSSWGYDQTNIDFYKVIALTPKGVKVQRWTSRMVGPHGPTEQVVPGDGPVTGGWVRTAEGSHYDPDLPAPIMTKRLTDGYRGQACFTVASYANAYHWDGKPETKTGTYYGR